MSSLRQRLRELLRRIGEDPYRHSNVDVLSKASQERAIQLLKQNLSPAQRAQYQKLGHFNVTGGDTGRTYRIRQGVQMNVEQLDRAGRRIRMLCFVPVGHLPVGDIMLAQKIALELFEKEAVRIANKAPTPEVYVWN